MTNTADDDTAADDDYTDDDYTDDDDTAADDDYIRVETCTDPCGPKRSKRQQVLQLMMTITFHYY